MSKSGMRNVQTKSAAADLGKALLKIVFIGVAGGAALIAGGKAAGEKLLNEEKLKKLSDK